MNSELIWVLSMLVGAIFLFITNRVRMDVVALLIIILFVLSGTLTLPSCVFQDSFWYPKPHLLTIRQI